MPVINEPQAGYRIGCFAWMMCLLAFASSRAATNEVTEPDNPETLRVGIYNNSPKIYLDDDGQASGFFPAILNYIAREEGWRIRYVPGSWKECLDRLAAGEIDLIPDMAINPERQEQYTFNNETVLISWAVIYSNPDVAIHSLLDLEGKRIALMKGSVYNEGKDGIRHILNQFAVTAEYLEYDSYAEVFNALNRHEADVGVVNNIFGAYSEKEYHVVCTPVLFSPSQLRFAFSKNSPVSAAIVPVLDKHLRALKQNQDSFFYHAMETHLFGTPRQENQPAGDWSTALTADERAWLQQHPDIRIAYDPEFYPFEFQAENGTYQGIAADYIHLLNQDFGIPLRVEDKLDRKAALAAVQRHEVDVLPCIGYTKKRAESLLFSIPYVTYQRVILTRSDMPFIAGPADIETLRVGVQQDTSHEAFLRENSTIQTIGFPSVQEALLALSGGKIDAVVANLSSSVYWIRKLNLINLKVAAPASSDISTLHFAVRSDWPELVSILNKALNRITPDRRRDIERRWVAVEYKPGIDTRMLWRIGWRVAAVIILSLAAMSIWTWRLKKEIALRRAAEAELARYSSDLEDINRKLQELDRLKNMFIASVSHELRTPLNSIIGFTGVILKGMAGPLNPKQQEQLNRVYHSAHHLLALITDIIDISKIEAGSVEIYAETFPLDEMIREAVDSIRPQAMAKSLTLDIDIPEPQEVCTDRKRLRQCLLNYLSNAVKYTETGGIRVVLRMVEDRYEISVIDTGIGITPEDLKRIFEPFVRLDSHLRIKAGGAGLGLYLTRKIITDILQGTLSVTSEPGRGSSFVMSAPRKISSGIVEQKGTLPV